jgi:fructose-1,6-bisphosphatase/inositol monophosphatase family enzyme
LPDIRELLQLLRAIHDRVRDAVVEACERQSVAELSGIDREAASDTIYSIDVAAEDTFRNLFQELRLKHSFVLIGEGLAEDPQDDTAADWRIIVDPIDGTRGLMYQKRSAWILTGVAPNRGLDTSLDDIVLALQTEIPIVKQHLSDQLWAIRDQGVHAERRNRLTAERQSFQPRPSRADSIAHGFATISRFFPGARDELASIDEEIVRGALGPVRPGRALCFEDQYISTGGQLYELIMGHDRFVADIRPLMRTGMCCHPYDICTELIAREAGVIITDAAGRSLRAPLDVRTNVAWVGFANAGIRSQIEPLLQSALRKRGMIEQ